MSSRWKLVFYKVLNASGVFLHTAFLPISSLAPNIILQCFISELHGSTFLLACVNDSPDTAKMLIALAFWALICSLAK